MPNKNNKSRNAQNGTQNSNQGETKMANTSKKMSDAQRTILAKFYEAVGWDQENADAEKAKMKANLESLKAQVVRLEADLSGFDSRFAKAEEYLAWFDGGPMSASASDEDRVAFLANAFHTKVRKAGTATADGAPKVKATDEEKEAALEALTSEGQTVGQIAESVGKDTKETARILKALVQDGHARTTGERRGTRYHLASEAVDSEDDEA